MLNMLTLKRLGLIGLLLLNHGCTVMTVAGAAVSVASTAVSVTATAVKTTAKVAGAVVDAAIPDDDEESEQAKK